MLHNILKKSIHFHQKTVFPYNSFHFFQVIYEVQNYKHFVPFCSNSTIIKKKGFSYFEAELTVNFKLYSDSYISKVTSEI